jgi:hypothetical protein
VSDGSWSVAEELNARRRSVEARNDPPLTFSPLTSRGEAEVACRRCRARRPSASAFGREEGAGARVLLSKAEAVGTTQPQ